LSAKTSPDGVADPKCEDEISLTKISTGDGGAWWETGGHEYKRTNIKIESLQNILKNILC